MINIKLFMVGVVIGLTMFLIVSGTMAHFNLLGGVSFHTYDEYYILGGVVQVSLFDNFYIIFTLILNLVILSLNFLICALILHTGIFIYRKISVLRKKK